MGPSQRRSGRTARKPHCPSHLQVQAAGAGRSQGCRLVAVGVGAPCGPSAGPVGPAPRGGHPKGFSSLQTSCDPHKAFRKFPVGLNQPDWEFLFTEGRPRPWLHLLNSKGFRLAAAPTHTCPRPRKRGGLPVQARHQRWPSKVGRRQEPVFECGGGRNTHSDRWGRGQWARMAPVGAEPAGHLPTPRPDELPGVLGPAGPPRPSPGLVLQQEGPAALPEGPLFASVDTSPGDRLSLRRT